MRKNSNRLDRMMKQGRLHGHEAGKLIGENFLGMLQGNEGFLDMHNAVQLRNAVRVEDYPAVRKIGHACQQLFQYTQDAEMASLRAERDIYRFNGLLGIMVAKYKDDIGKQGQWAALASLELLIRIHLMQWFGLVVIIEYVSRAIEVDFSELLSERANSIQKAIDQYNQLVSLLTTLINEDELLIHRLEVSDLQPTESWCEQLEQDLLDNGVQNVLSNSISPLFKSTAIPWELPVQE